MTPEEQARVVAELPDEVTDAELSPPEGDQHFLGKVRAFDTLKGHFGREGRRVYLACELPVYYPAERRFAPDLLAVVDAEPRERGKWVVSAEGKGLDFVLEVHVGGDRKKDAVRNVERYCRLGIPEYFIYDAKKQELWGYRLAKTRERKYVLIKPVKGRLVSRRLGLAVQVDDGRLRFFENDNPLPESGELIDRLQELTGKLQRRVKGRARRLKKETRLREETEQRLAEETRIREKIERRLAEETRLRAEETRLRAEETRLRTEETRLRTEAQQQLKKLQAELARLKGRGS
ncbi:Uma2 family endonuclease [Pyxidicoccus xibeiensis]|uniref:Uma2 family endonuclease n=1 Tax=Pyxidicoccus xibeiensis TaxID=2906759 RepID=UPI002B1EDA2E|nr:Uma2 family endonuclease [Pyxidicoccus xibeiensis]